MAGIFESSMYDSAYDESHVQERREPRAAQSVSSRIEDYVGLDNPVRAIDSFVCALDLAKLGSGMQTAAWEWDNRLTTRPIC